MKDIPYGYCHCGCLRKTSIVTHTDKRKGHVLGKPVRFISGHNASKGRRYINKRNFVLVYNSGHHRSNCQEYVFEHLLIAENALGRPIEKNIEIHHLDGDRTNNAGNNLVICQDHKYHHLLHMRANALLAGYPAYFRRCYICKKHDDPKNLYIGKENVHHRKCFNEYCMKRKEIRKNG